MRKCQSKRQPSGIARRRVISGLPLGIVTAFSPALPPYRKAVALDPATLAAMATAVRLVGQFAASSDGGLGATLRSVSEKVDVLANQVGVLQVELGKLAVAVGNLPSQFEEVVERNLIRERIITIQGAMERWVEVTERVSVSDNKPTNADRVDLEEIRQTARRARSELSGNEIGAQSLAATVAMSALFLELNTTLRLQDPNQDVVPMLARYINWMDRVLNASERTSAERHLINLRTEIERDIKTFRDSVPLQGSIFNPDRAEWIYRNGLAICYTQYFGGRGPRLHGGPHTNGSIDYGEPPAERPSANVSLRWLAGYRVRDNLRQWFIKWTTTPPAREGGARREIVVDQAFAPAPACTPIREHRRPEQFSPTSEAAQLIALQMQPIPTREAELAALKQIVDNLNILEARKLFVELSINVAQMTKTRAVTWERMYR